MRFIDIKNPGLPLSLGDVLDPGVCWPPEVSMIDFAALGFAVIDEGTPPSIDEATQTVAPGPVELVGEVWTQTYVVSALPADVVAKNAAAALDLAFHDAQGGMQNYMNGKAAERNYDSIQSAALRAAYPGPYHDEGVAYGTWMDTCWQHCYTVLADVQAGRRAIPTTDQLIAELPTLVLPDRAA
jgi:hypothetical protein